MNRPFAVAALALALATPALAQPADEAGQVQQESSSASSGVYVSVFAGTTLLSRTASGEVHGPSQDLTPMVGIGYNITPTVALELDVGPTFVAGSGYTGLAVVPGVVWAPVSWFYLCGRFPTTVHPTPAIALMPGFGFTVTFGSWAPFVEVDALASRNATGNIDLAAGVSVGLARYF